MGTARRLYVYIVSAVSLFALAAGLVSLLQSFLREVEGASVLTGGSVSREQLSLAIALILVGAPIWVLHWWLARRGLRAAGAAGDEERASAIRAWYIALVQAVSLGAGLASLIGLGAAVLARLFGVPGAPTWADSLAIALVAVPVWAAFARSRAAEIRATRMTGSAARATRLYRYGGAFASLMVMLVGSSGLVSTVLSVLVNRPDFGLDEPWWREVASGQISAIAIGFGAWLVHWRDAGSAIRDAARIGEDDRETRLRAAYFGGVLVVAAAWAGFIVAGAIADLGRWAAGLNAGDTLAFLEQVVGPPLAVVPVMAAGWWHARHVSGETADLGELRVTSSRRNELLLLSLVGLAFLAAGSVQLIEMGIERLGATTEPSMLGDGGSLREVPWYLAQLIVGTALWLPAWAGILSARARNLAGERAAAASRAHLFLVVGAAIVAAVPTATITLYRVLDTFLGGRPATPLLVDLAFPIAVVVVAGAVGAYHARLLLGDIRAVGAEAPVGAEAVAMRAEAVTVLGELELELTLHAPAGTDMAAAVAGMREHIPPGATLEEHDGERALALSARH